MFVKKNVVLSGQRTGIVVRIGKLIFLKVLARDHFLNFIRCFILAAAPLSFQIWILLVPFNSFHHIKLQIPLTCRSDWQVPLTSPYNIHTFSSQQIIRTLKFNRLKCPRVPIWNHFPISISSFIINDLSRSGISN